MDVISAILDIENTAKEMMENARRQSEELLSQAKENEQSIKEDIAAEVDRALSRFEDEQRQEADSEKQRIALETQAAMDRLDGAYESLHGQWETQILSSIIGKRS